MLIINKPLYFEDTTGKIHMTDLDDIYDRMFFKVTQHVTPKGTLQVCVYDSGHRSSRRRNSNNHYHSSSPSIILEFGGAQGKASLGTITVGRMPTIYMKDYLRKIGTFGSSLNRKFIASDSNEYRWSRGTVPGQTWTCFNASNQVIAHYSVQSSSSPGSPTSYSRKSENTFVVEEYLLEVSVEILATLIIMRHIEEYRL